ncbi:MAG: HEAT repeat domain-containing protein [Sedimentisphaerales bacterium]
MTKFRIFFIITILTAINYCNGSESVKNLVPEAEKIVADELNNSNISVRDNVIEVIASCQKTEMMPKVAAFLNDSAVPVRFIAAMAIGDMQYTQSVSKLKKLLNDPDINIAAAACYALYKISGEEKYLKSLEDYALVTDQTVKANVAMLLGKLKNPRCLPILYKLKDSQTSSDSVAYNATEAIARIGDEKIYNRIWTLLISVYVDDRCMGVQAMGALNTEKGKNAILTMLDDDNPQVRLVAAGQLGQLGDKSGQSVVLEYLNSPQSLEKAVSERQNVLAALAIGQIGTEPLIAHLPKLLKNESPFVRLAGAKSVFIIAKAAKQP